MEWLHAKAQGMTGRRLAMTDLGNAELFAILHGERFRYVKERRSWLVWSDGRWQGDATGEAERAAKDTVRELLRRAADIEDESEQKRAVQHALSSQQEPRLRAILALAATEPEFALAADALNSEPYLLACSNGTLDLRTGALRRHDPSDLISLGTEVFFHGDAACPRWRRFLDEVFDGDEELVSFVKRAVGYSLTGDIREHALFICHGSGCNGKTTFHETINRVLGNLAKTASFDSFLRSRGDRGARNDIARLHRARLVAAAESGAGRRLDEAMVKMLTGGDTVTARFLYGEHFEFRPEFKLWLFTNHVPRVEGDDEAIWRRLRLVPFDVSFQGREDRNLDETLTEELPGILAWAVEGCLEWQESGLGLPPAVARATAEYRESEDILGAFLAERCVLEGDVEAGVLRDAHDKFCHELGETPLAAAALGKALAQRGIPAKRHAGQRFYQGLRLR